MKSCCEGGVVREVLWRGRAEAVLWRYREASAVKDGIDRGNSIY